MATPSAQHPIKQLAFNSCAVPGDDDYGNLYVLHGDGVDSPSLGTGREGDTPLGKILRVDPIQDGSSPYTVPNDNPFVDEPGTLDEIYSSGHRNVHTIAFAKDSNGITRLFISEVGHGSIEEVNIVTAGADYGWGQYEGTFVRPNSFGLQSATVLPSNTIIADAVFPVTQYGHDGGGEAIAGGFGVIDSKSELFGYYFFSDFSNDEKPIFAIAIDDAVAAITSGNTDDLAPVQPQTVAIVFDHDDDPSTPSIPIDPDGNGASFLEIVQADGSSSNRTDIRFGQGSDGKIYLTNKRNGIVYEISNSIATKTPPQVVSADIDTDFTIETNPANGWTHGFNDLGDGDGNDIENDVSFQLANLGGTPGDRWTGDGTGDMAFPPNDLLLVNLGNGGTQPNHWGGGSISWDTDSVYHTWGDSEQSGGANGLSGDDTIFSSYEVPQNGLYCIEATWIENGNSGAADVEILVNSQSMFSSSISLEDDGDDASVMLPNVSMQSGDVVSFRTTRTLLSTTGGSARLMAQINSIEFLLGDINHDGIVNLLDVAPFVELISTGEYNAAADINLDGAVNLLDVGPFIDVLGG